MALPPRDHRISLADASVLTKRHSTANPNAEKAGTFHKDQVLELLSQPGCVALRIYHGSHADGRPALVLSAVNAAADDLTEGIILEEHYPCPPYCGAANALNS